MLCVLCRRVTLHDYLCVVAATVEVVCVKICANKLHERVCLHVLGGSVSVIINKTIQPAERR